MTKSNHTGGETELGVEQREKMGREKIREEGKDLPGPSWVATQNKRDGTKQQGAPTIQMYEEG